MRHGRKPVEFAAILFFPPPSGGGGAGAGWESVPVLRLGGATGMAAGVESVESAHASRQDGER